ncbi:unnamed protein product, partial [Polarella glacialis]
SPFDFLPGLASAAAVSAAEASVLWDLRDGLADACLDGEAEQISEVLRRHLDFARLRTRPDGSLGEESRQSTASFLWRAEADLVSDYWERQMASDAVAKAPEQRLPE